MTPEALNDEVNNIIGMSGDPEGAHSAEDELHIKLIDEFCPDWVLEEVNRLSDADFPRWRA